MIKYYRKADLLNRIYVLNYFSTRLLDQPYIAKLPQPEQVVVAALKAKSYVNLDDLQLILYVLPKNKIRCLFRYVLIAVMATDKKLVLNGELMMKLSQQLSNQELNLMFKLNGKDTFTNVMMVIDSYPLEIIVDHLLHQYFAKFVTNLNGINHDNRFVSLVNQDHKLYTLLSEWNIDTLLEEGLRQILPATYALIQGLKSIN